MDHDHTYTNYFTNGGHEAVVTKPQRRWKRLRFKKRIKPKLFLKKVATNTHDVATSGHVSTVKAEKERSELFDRHTNVIEYGPSVHGYNFIAFSESDIPQERSDENPPLVSEKESSDSETSSNRSNFQETPSEYNYNVYLNAWADIENGIKYYKTPFPTKTDEFGDISVSSIINFLETKANVRQERIRWHPDRMKQILLNSDMWDDHQEKDVTHVFQVINEAYDRV